MFGPDIEGLLPMHYYAERHDKDMHLDLMQFVLQVIFVVSPLLAQATGRTNSHSHYNTLTGQSSVFGVR